MNFESKILEQEHIKRITPNLNALKLVSYKTACRAQMLFFDIEWKKLKALTTNNQINLVNQIKEKVQLKWYKVDFYYTDDESFTKALRWYDKLLSLEEQAKKEEYELKTATDTDAIKMIKKLYDNKEKYAETDFIREIIRLAFMAGSSDIHFQSEERWVVLRVRKDGVLKQLLVFSHQEFRKYLIKLKWMAKVKFNIDYIPQDWRFDFLTHKDWKPYKIDVRVNFMPALHWESIVMRFLDSSTGIRSFDEMWFFDKNLEILQRNIHKTHGMILVTWPTGSGKSTTMYSILSKLNSPENKIITLEDPVEYELPWIQQSQINPDKWYTYVEWLKAILRQDPDIIMVWEIRDLETAEISINAALTWHLVLATLHTNTSIEAVSRLLNMWVKPFMLWPALNLVIGQRLLRKLCDCKTQRQLNMWEQEEINYMIKKIKDVQPFLDLQEPSNIFEPAWCEKCSYDWYKWRIAAIETFEVTDEIKDMIVKEKSTLDIYSMVREWWFLSMKEDAIIKMLRWYTTLTEIRRVLW